jgi:alpha/beta hydrolase fold
VFWGFDDISELTLRRLVVTALMSLDGVASAPERLLPLWDEENKRYALSEFTEFDALLFGRVTYEGHQAHHIAVAGGSSGGGLGVGLLLRLRDQQLPLPACALIISGWIDMTMSGQSYSSQMSAPAIASNPSGTPPSIAFTVVTLDKRSI